MNRRYFILDRISPDELEALDACVGENWTQRYSLDYSQVLIKVESDFLAAQEVGFIDKLGVEYRKVDLKPIISSDFWQDNSHLI